MSLAHNNNNKKKQPKLYITSHLHDFTEQWIHDDIIKWIPLTKG